MSIRKVLMSLSLGILFAIFALGILPFLVVYSWTELYGLADLYPPPFPFSIMQKWLK